MLWLSVTLITTPPMRADGESMVGVAPKHNVKQGGKISGNFQPKEAATPSSTWRGNEVFFIIEKKLQRETEVSGSRKKMWCNGTPSEYLSDALQWEREAGTEEGDNPETSAAP